MFFHPLPRSQPALQTTAQNPGLVHASGPQLQTTKMEASPRQQLANNNNNSLLQVRTSNGCIRVINVALFNIMKGHQIQLLEPDDRKS